MAALALIAGSILGWVAALIAVVFLDANWAKATTVFFTTSLGFACSWILLARLRQVAFGEDEQDAT